MRVVYDGEMGVNQSSKEYGVPTATLFLRKDHITSQWFDSFSKITLISHFVEEI